MFCQSKHAKMTNPSKNTMISIEKKINRKLISVGWNIWLSKIENLNNDNILHYSSTDKQSAYTGVAYKNRVNSTSDIYIHIYLYTK